jgi:DNA anti-recombination protein RmuC
MKQFLKAVGVFLVAAFGLWGCAQGPGGSTASDRLKALEAKNARLEEDFRTASAARDQLRKKLTATEEAQTQLQQDLDELKTLLTKERDDLKGQLNQRIQERDVLQSQYDGFRRDLKDLLGQAEAALNRPNDNDSAVDAPASGRPAGPGLALPSAAGGSVTPMLPGGGD